MPDDVHDARASGPIIISARVRRETDMKDIFVVRRLTGHMHSGSAYETDSDCGNCDGARCDGCRSLYHAYGWSEEFAAAADAQAHGAEQFRRQAGLFEGGATCTYPVYVVKDGKLFAEFYEDGKDGALGGDVVRECNPESLAYAGVLADVLSGRRCKDGCTTDLELAG